MALDSAQLMQVLDQYQSRLHKAGNETHDEEFEYVRQIVASPIFHQFLRGEISQEVDVEISQASQKVISTDIQTEAIVSELTTSEIQKRRLARRKSLKALRNAVMSPNTGSHVPGKKNHTPSSRANDPNTSSSSVAITTNTSSTSLLKHTHTKSYSGSELTRLAVNVTQDTHLHPTPSEHHIHTNTRDEDKKKTNVSSQMTNGTDIDTPLEGLGRSERRMSPTGSEQTSPPSSILSPRTRNLSNSTNTLIERLSPPIGSPVKNSGYGGMGNGRVTSAESHPNVHSLGLNHRPEMDKDLFSMPMHLFSGPNPVPDWNGKDHYSNEGDHTSSSHTTHPYILSPTSLTSHRPSFITTVTTTTTPTPHRITLTNDLRHPTPLAPPPYNHHGNNTAAAHRRTKSFEDILNSPEFDPLNFHGTPIPPSSLMAPQIEIENHGPSMVCQRSRLVHFDLYLEKGSEGLGFLVNNREGGKGGLVVKCLSPGGLAERDGRLKPNDIITAINSVSLDDTSHSEAVRLLQAVRGVVQLSCLREQDTPPSSSPPPHPHPPPSPLTLTSNPPPLSPSAHTHTPPSPLTILSHPHNTAVSSIHSQPPPSPLSLTSHPPHQPPFHTATPTDIPIPTPSPISDSSINSVVPDMTFDTATGQPLRQQIRTIHLPSSSEGLGVSLVAHGNGGTMVAAILEKGAARKDGRLSKGDRFLQVNEESVIHMRCEDVAAKLSALGEAGEAIRLVVAHTECEGDSAKEQEVIPEVMDSSGDELDEFEVELSKQGGGLGITIAGLVSEETGDELKGLYITSINAHGAVGKDGRPKVNDRILRVDGHSLRGLENMEAAAMLRNSGNPVRLVFGRPKATRKYEEREDEKDSPPSDDVERELHLHSNSQSEAGNDRDWEEKEEEEEVPGKLDSLGGNGEDAELMKKWKNVMGPTAEIKIARVMKAGTHGGLGICMESTVQLDDTGKPQEGSTRHIITLVKDGPVKKHGQLKGGDEILQVNNTEVLGLEHDQAIEVVKETPVSVMIVVCRPSRPVTGEEEEEGMASEEQREDLGSETVSVTVESDEEKHPDDSAHQDEHLAPPTKDSSGSNKGERGGFGGKDISRRFERQSWRERHAEERRRLKHRFEQRREEYERHIRDLEEELLQREKEQKEMLMMAAEAEEGEEKEGGRERRRSTLLHPSSSPNKFDYSAYHDTAATTFTFPEFAEREVGSPDTDSSLGVLSPVPGTGFWEPDITKVLLHKGEEGLGFSILDFADPHNEGERIILIQSLVEGGVAEQDGRLRVGDRLVSVNDVSVINTSLQFAVQQLVVIPQGTLVELGIHHPVLAESDFSDSSSFSPLPPTSPTHDVHDHPQHDSQISLPPFHHHDDMNRNETIPGNMRFTEEVSGLTEVENSVVADGDSGEGHSSYVEEREDEVSETRQEDDEDGKGEGSDKWKMKTLEKTGEIAKEKKSEKTKKLPALESEDDEPPPPYSRTDPQDDKIKQGASEPPHSPRATISPEVPGNKSDRRESISPLQLSRISSPSRGLSLSELTRVTPEDQERWRQSRESLERERSLESLTEITNRTSLPTRDRFGGSLEIHASHHVREWSQSGLSPTQTQPPKKVVDERRTEPAMSAGQKDSPSVSEVGGGSEHSQMESNSDTTLVGSQSQSDTGVSPVTDEKEVEKRTNQQPQLRLEPVANKKKARRSPRGSRSPKQRGSEAHPQTGKNTDTKTSTLAVTYSHSQVTNTSSQDSIQDGLSPDMSDYDHSSELDNEPREIHIAKTSSNFGLTLTQDSKTNSILVKSVKGATRKDGRIRVGDQILAINREWLENISLAKASKMLKKAASKSDGVNITYLPAPHGLSSSSSSYGTKSVEKAAQLSSQHYSTSRPLQQNVPGNVSEQDTFVGGQSQNVSIAPTHPNIMPPQMAPPQMSQWTSYPLGPGAAISPIQPPPYNYMPQTTQQTYGQHLQQVVWQVQQPGSLQLPVGQPAPQQVAWILREPPHYVDHVVQQHMMSAGAPYPLSQTTGPVSVPTLHPQPPTQTAQPAPSLTSQPIPSQTTAVHTQSITTTNVPRMTKAQSEIELQSGNGARKPEQERRHKSQSGTPSKHPPHPYTVYRRRQQQQAQAAAAAAAAASRMQHQPTLIEDPSESRTPPSPPRSRDTSHEYSRRSNNMSRDLTHPPNEVGHGGGGGTNAHQQQLRNSVDREVEDDSELRKEFPNVDGVLFEVWLNKGSRGLGMSIVANRDDHAPGPRGIVIMGIQPGGVADHSKMVMLGDMILKINDTCVIGMTQQEVQEMLMEAALHVRFVMLRQAEGKVLDRTAQPAPPAVDSNLVSCLPQVRVVQLQRDNEKGLGFTVTEGSQAGVVNIASITSGGPAEKEGTLQPGDQLISIDGQKNLGFSAEKARHLLQQARARGWVQLIVTCHGGATSGGEGGVNMKSNIPDSVVLRQKKRNRESSLKSSRRRPVSVDSEASVVRSTSASRTRDRRTVGGGEQKLDRGERRGGSGGRSDTGEKSNQNSHTLTEREVEIGFQKMEKHNVITPGRECRITIFKGSQVLGLTVLGGVDTYLHNIIIERIIPDSPADKDGRLRPGDRILEVNDISMDEATLEDALAALQYPSPFIPLTVLRVHNHEPLPKEPPAVSPTTQIETVELIKPVRAGLGLLIQEPLHQAGVYIKEVVENQAAYLDGRIKTGDKILAINHTSTVVASQDTVFKLLQSCVGKVVLTVQHRDALSPPMSSIDYPVTEPGHQFSGQHPQTVQYPSHNIPNRDPPPYPSPFSSYLPDPQIGGARGSGAMWGSSPPPLPPPAPQSVHRSGEGKIKHVKLRKGPSGLGFTIVGGAGSSHGDKPIYVNRVLELEGVAGRDQRLFKGDQLLAVNGISFEGVTHQFAAETLKQQSRHGDVELAVLSFE